MAAWQLGLRALVLALPFVAVVAARGQAPGLLIVLVAVAAAATATVPDSPAGLAVVVLLGWLWATQVDVDVTVWTLAAALSVGAFHVVTAYAALLPIGAGWDGESARRWLRRLGVVLGATTAMWAMAFGVSRADPTSNALLLGGGLAATAALAWILRARSVA